MQTLMNNSVWSVPVEMLASVILASVIIVMLGLVIWRQRRHIRRMGRQLKDSQQVTQRFSDLLSHELRNPMNAITGHLDLMEGDRAITTEQQYHLARIRTASRILIDQLDDILSVAVGFHDEDEPTKSERFAIAALCRDVVNEFSASIGSAHKPVNIELSLDDQVPENLIGPRKAIRIALRHLISNAIRYGHGKAVSIEVSCRGATPAMADGMLAIRVRDQGAGLTQDMSQSLFRLFSHLRPHDHANAADPIDRHQTMPHGIGRGLPISKQVIERCGGRLGFLSRPNHGSVFWLRVPVRADAVITTAHGKTSTANPASPPPSTPVIRQHNMRVIVLDDLPGRADIFAEYLSLLLPHDCDIVECQGTDRLNNIDPLPHAFYLVASDSFTGLSPDHQQSLMGRAMLVLDYGHGQDENLPAERLVGPYDPNLLSRLDGMVADHPLRCLMAKATG